MQQPSLARLLWHGDSRWIVGIAPAVKYLLISTVCTDLGQIAVEVLLQLRIVQTEAGCKGYRRQAGIHKVVFRRQLLVKHEGQALVDSSIHLALVKGSHDVGRRAEA